MCGIAGFIGFESKDLIKKMSSDLEHRGPDGEGFYIDKNTSLLNRRLAIIDRKGGDQPIFNEDKTVCVVYNGEIYNYLELRNELEKSGHKFKTKSDTEIIVHGYEEWGDRAFDKYNGMFGVALYDIKKERLLLARDHFGIKPLYYASIPMLHRERSLLKTDSSLRQLADSNHNDLKLLFSSEIKPLLNSKLIEIKPNDKTIYRYLKFRVHDDGEETFFKGIFRLLPGEMLVVEKGKINKKSFTNLKEELSSRVQENYSKEISDEDINKFREILTDAVKKRLVSEVPVGSCLSGGIDSSTVVAMINGLLKENIKESKSVGEIQNTFSAVFPNSANNEDAYINDMVSKYSQKNHKVYASKEEFFSEISEFIKIQEEPTISTGPYAQYKVMEEVHKNVTVVLDGQGADEMMAGYLPYYFVYFNQLLKHKKYLKLAVEIFESFDVLFKYFLLKVKGDYSVKADKVLNKDFLSKFSDEKFPIVTDNLKQRLIDDIFKNSLQSLLRYEDRNSMHFSVEGRVPFLDLNLIRYIFDLPDSAIIKNGWNKFILREATKDILPESIRKRRNKIGFTTPEYEWFVNSKKEIYEFFLSESFSKRAYWDDEKVLKAFREFCQGKNQDTLFFWRLINLEIWMRTFIDQKFESYKVIKSESQNTKGKIKKDKIIVEEKKYYRYLIRTDAFQKGDDVVKKVSDYSLRLINQSKWNEDKKFFVVISEKIVAISQGRSYFIWDIKTGFWSNLFSKFVRKTPYGIGLGSPWTMQLAIDEIGLPRIAFAALFSAITRPFGMKGIFYRIAGRSAAEIDGPTEYSLYPSNVSAKLGPKNPEKVAEEISAEIKYQISNIKYQNDKSNINDEKTKNFLGVAIIDANDLGVNILGNSTDLSNKVIEQIFKDNPMGQGREQTPIAIVESSK